MHMSAKLKGHHLLGRSENCPVKDNMNLVYILRKQPRLHDSLRQFDFSQPACHHCPSLNNPTNIQRQQHCWGEQWTMSFNQPSIKCMTQSVQRLPLNRITPTPLQQTYIYKLSCPAYIGEMCKDMKWCEGSTNSVERLEIRNEINELYIPINWLALMLLF